MTERIYTCPNPLCKLPMRALTVKKKLHEYFCETCETSVTKVGDKPKAHYKRHVERWMEQGHTDDEQEFKPVQEKETSDENTKP